MNSPERIRELVEHNYWARDRQLEVASTLTTEQFLRPMGNSFSSLRDTLGHLVAVEWIWLERWRGRSARSLQSAEAYSNLDTLIDRWKVVEIEMRGFLGRLDSRSLAAPVTYTNLRGELWTYPLEEMIVHVFTHQIYHRGQVTMIFRLLGAKPVMVDYLKWYEEALQIQPAKK